MSSKKQIKVSVEDYKKAKTLSYVELKELHKESIKKGISNSKLLMSVGCVDNKTSLYFENVKMKEEIAALKEKLKKAEAEIYYLEKTQYEELEYITEDGDRL